MIRTPTVLADGRELFYYSVSEPLVTPPPDARPLERSEGAGELRYDALNDEWVAVAGHRQGRIFLPSTAECPLCPTTAGNLTEIPAAEFDVVVFENRFPSLQDPGDAWAELVPGLDGVAPNAGRCEVICFSDDHHLSFRELPSERVRLVVDAWADRTAALMELPFVTQVFAFENCGEEIGVTIRHPHGQIYGYPFVPPRALGRLRAAAHHRATTGRDLVGDLIEQELADGRRVVSQGEHWVVFVPYAARWPLQAQVHPRRAVRDLTELTDAERDEFAVMYLDLLGRLDAVFNVRMPYIAGWFQAPKGPLRDDGRLYLEIITNRRAPDKLKYLAGSEAAMGAFINDISPERAAAMLREALG